MVGYVHFGGTKVHMCHHLAGDVRYVISQVGPGGERAPGGEKGTERGKGRRAGEGARREGDLSGT